MNRDVHLGSRLAVRLLHPPVGTNPLPARSLIDCHNHRAVKTPRQTRTFAGLSEEPEALPDQSLRKETSRV